MANRDKHSIRRNLLAGFALLFVSGLASIAVAAPIEASAEQSEEAAGSTPPEIPAHGASSDAPLADVWPSVSVPWTGDLNGMLERGEIRVLTAFSLGAYYIDRGRPRGAIFEAIGLFEKFVKTKLGAPAKNLKVVVIPVRRDQLLPFLVKGYGDLVMAQQLITPRRLESVDFSVPFAEKGREYVITGPASTGVAALDDLAGEEVVVHEESSHYERLTALNERFRGRGKPEIQITVADPGLETEDLLEMVNAGLLPMTVADGFRTEIWTKVFNNLRTNDDLVIADEGQVAPAIRKNSPQFKALVDEFVSKHRKGMKIPNIIIRRYKENADWVKPALEREPFRRLEEIEGLFKKYGERFGFDWVLLASFAFQESGFNQKARSRAGAIGIMQVLPSTAADRSVAIKNIHTLENNIHAGTKYLSVLRDRYFSDEALDPFQRSLFTMAGYNAGPNRINRLRNEAPERKLDANLWFGNVELVVAAEVGREPVRYVGNIYKYYIAYKRVLKVLEARQEARDQAR